jgi:hypothetical protein
MTFAGLRSRADLSRDLERLVRGKSADPVQERGEVLAIDILHRQEVPALVLGNVVDAADVGVGDLAGGPNFRMEAPQVRIVTERSR